MIGQEIDLWDYGGQKVYRDRYLESKTDLLGLHFMFYLIDAQIGENFDESMNYLSEILTKVPANFDRSNLIICLHKYDPGDTGPTKEQLSTIKGKISDVFDDVQIAETLIFDEKSVRCTFSMGLRKAATDKEIIEEELTEACEAFGLKGVVVLEQDS
ncbi:MAG: hypothetical protein ACFFDT_24675 [Candidatus Hodarchaeota archaeon]